jgi:hypothetical protein
MIFNLGNVLDLDLQTLIDSVSSHTEEEEEEEEGEHLHQCSICADSSQSVRKNNDFFLHLSFSYFTSFFPTPPIKLELRLQKRLGRQVRSGQTTNSNPSGPIKLSTQSKTEPPPRRKATINKHNF